MKHEAFGHSKVGRLCRALNIEPWGARGIVQSVWHVTAIEAPRGDLGKMADEDIAYQIGWQGEPGRLVSALVDSGWLDESDEFRLVVHDWSHHCEDSVHSKLARAGLTFCDGTQPKLHRLTQRERDRIEARQNAAAETPRQMRPAAPPLDKAKRAKPEPATAPDPDFDTFWRCYPRKKDKPDALKAWRQTAKERPPIEQLLQALKTEIEEKRRKPDWLDYMKYPAGWLRNHSWNNEVLVERMTHAGSVTVPVPAIFQPAPEAAPEPDPETPEDIERESWIETFTSHGLPQAAEEAATCSMERLHELQELHKPHIERIRAAALAKIRAGRLVA